MKLSCLLSSTAGQPAIFARALVALSLVAAAGCGDSGTTGDAQPPLDSADASAWDGSAPPVGGDSGLFPGVDGGSDGGEFGGFDASTYDASTYDAGPVVDSSVPDTGVDASTPDASVDSGPVVVPDASTTPDASPAPGAIDKSAPCSELGLLCFDFIDMFIFNPELCFTCNGGQGCQGCAIPFAY